MLSRQVAIGVALLISAAPSSGQEYPNRMIRIITSGIGGFADVSARMIADGLSRRVGQSVIVDNRPSQLIAMETALKATPDGYSLFLNGSTVWLAPVMYPNLAYEPLKEFTPITLTTRTPYLIVVNPSVPAKSVSELIALAKAKPGQLNYGAGNAQGTPNTAARLFNSMAGIDIVNVPYKSTAPALLDVVAGRIHVMFSTAAAMPYVKSGKLRALAVTSAEPTALAPGLPPVATALPGYEATSTLAIFIQAKASAPILKRLNQEIVAVLSSPEVKDKLLAAGADAVPTTPERAMATAKSERQRLGKIVKELGAGEG